MVGLRSGARPLAARRRRPHAAAVASISVIITRLVGGLGNQLFQYAAGRSLAARLGAELLLDSSWIDGAGGAGRGSVRRYALACFALTAPLVQARRIARLPPRSRRAFYAQRLLPSRKPAVTALVEEATSAVDRRFFSAEENTLLLGFWESEDYFAEHADTIRADLQLAEAPSAGPTLIPEVGAGNTVSLHVRRGDKLTPGVIGKYVSLTPQWYAAAVEEVARRTDRIDAVYVFSDDPAWCRRELDLPYPTTVVEGNPDHVDLRLMSLCRHHVVANSTFSWWGAWLDPRPDAVVVAPARWRLDRPTVDVVPRRWVRLES